MEFLGTKHNFYASLQNVNKLFAIMVICALRAGAARKHEAVADHLVAALGEQLHGDPRYRLRPASPFTSANQMPVIFNPHA